MPEDRPSPTALRAAMHRAAHQVLDQPPVFRDPLALRLLGLDPDSGPEHLREWSERSPHARGLRAFLAARSRYAEDQLHLAAARGVGQYVVLGAGLDSFAYRNPFPPAALRVYEVDLPATQAWKRERLALANIPLPPGLAFAPLDFAAESLSEGLLRAGFDPAAPAFLSWLGVSQYLAPDGVDAVLRQAAALPPGSGIVFDYSLAPGLLSPAARQAYDRLAERVAAAGEPFRSSFDPAALAAALAGMGFSRTRSLGPGDLNALYFQERTDGLRTGGFTRLMHAGR